MNISAEILAAYREHEQALMLRKIRLGCFIGMLMVPAFAVLDWFVYEDVQGYFFLLRLGCSALIALFYLILKTRAGQRQYRAHGLILLSLPASCISWMIYVKGGATSPYYAGLILVLMVLAVVLDWTFRESIWAVALVLCLYLVACLLHGGVFQSGVFVNNFAFLASSGVIIITAGYFHGNLRLREFASRYELDQNRRALAAQNQVLEDTLVQLKETELQLVQTEKIVSLGRLSAGIIHEINNPLNFATTGLYVLKKQGGVLARDKPEEFTEVVQDISEGIERVKNIVSDLRTFTHPDAGQRDVIKVTEVVNASLRFLSNEWKDKVQVELAVPETLTIRANKNKLTQVFVNLLQNALDALKKKPPGDGPPAIRITGQIKDGRVVLAVRDNGEGIEPHNMSKIFDPFFTTRDVGQGMGMGLSICYRIIQEHEGTITVASERGKFCEFTVELPSADTKQKAD